MIGFNGLGKNGKIGNQMFQYAALKGIAAKHNYEWCIPPKDLSYDPHDYYQFFQIFNLSSAKNINYLPKNYPLLFELKFEHGIYFDENILNNCPDNVILGGYFQSEKYFKHIENEIRQDFTFKNDLLNFCKEIINEFGDCISIHIRRIDYSNRCLDFVYYLKALEYFNENKKVIIFSDDIEWCKNQKMFQAEKFFISPFENNSIDLCLMTLCSNHIIANSTFSWWGAWLSNSEKVIAPSKWFSKTQNDTKDVIPLNWIKI